MDEREYRRRFFVRPTPRPRFEMARVGHVALLVRDFEAAVEFYSHVLGPPAYVEEDEARGWPIGDAWLTLLPAAEGTPSNVEFGIETATPEEAERLREAFLAAGATGSEPCDTLMYGGVRYRPVTDPFGGRILIYSPLPER